MSVRCYYCKLTTNPSDGRICVSKSGYFKRSSDNKWIQKYFCKLCKKNFSDATSDSCYWQKKRHLNQLLGEQLASGMSQRRTAKILRINRKTVVRQFIFMGSVASLLLHDSNLKKPQASEIEFDDLETFEHTKCKPLSVSLAVESKTRRILGFRVSQMPAKGRLAKKAFKKYGPRADFRTQGREDLFNEIKPLVTETVIIKSDQNPHYPSSIEKHFPKAHHISFRSRRSSLTGQGELKKVGFDPLFSLNHTCAMLRENVNRLKRKTWSTTKKPERLSLHLALQAFYHNMWLDPPE